MTKNEIYEMMNTNPVFHLATLDGDHPRVRGMLLYQADETGIVFHSGTMKDVYHQIIKHPHAELCFFDAKNGTQVRVRGTLEIDDDQGLKDIISEHPTRQFLKGWKASVPLEDFYSTFAVFRLKHGLATTWTMDKNFDPKDQIEL